MLIGLTYKKSAVIRGHRYIAQTKTFKNDHEVFISEPLVPRPNEGRSAVVRSHKKVCNLGVTGGGSGFRCPGRSVFSAKYQGTFL